MISAFHHVGIMFQRSGKKAPIHFRVRIVVRVRKTYVQSPRRIQPRIPCGGNACIGLVQKDDSVILRLPPEQAVPCVVRGTVINADNFYAAKSLPGQAFQSDIYVSGYIIAGNDNGDVRRHKEASYG